MLHDFLTRNRAELLARCESKAARRRRADDFAGEEIVHGVTAVLGALIATLRMNGGTQSACPRGDGAAPTAGIADAAARHGLELLRNGLPIEEVVYAYGDLCQAVTELALEQDAPIRVDEFRTLNHCLDEAIADAVKQFSHKRDDLLAERAARALHERLGSLVHELRNHLHTATIALAASRAGGAGSTGTAAAIVDRSMLGMRTLIDRSLADVRAGGRLPPRREVIVLAQLVAEIETSAALAARARDCTLAVRPVDPTLAVYADRDLLLAAVGNLLQNAFKFTRRRTAVALSMSANGGRILIEVADRCGGLPAGALERIFLPFAQHGADRTGVGLGLSICRRSVEDHGGSLRVRDVPGVGCVFTIDLPRHALARTGT